MRAVIIGAVVARSLVALLCLSGCDKLFGLIPVDRFDAGSDGPADSPGDLGLDVATVCPLSYGITLGSTTSKYRVNHFTLPWSEAETACEQDSPGITHLVVLTDETERMPLATTLDLLTSSSMWIGLSDRVVENQFRWVTTEPVGEPDRTTPPWGTGQPSASMTQNCVVMLGAAAGIDKWRLADEACTATAGFVCECDFIPPAPNNF